MREQSIADGRVASDRCNPSQIRIADFVHGDDGLGNVSAKYFGDREGDMPTACRTGRAIDYLVEVTSGAGGQERITILALGPLTNVAFALKENPSMRAKVVWLGGAFHVNGNVNPSAEANVFCDPAAADFVLSSEAVKSGALDVYIVPLDVTQRCMFSDLNLSSIKEEAQRRAMGSTGIDVPGLEVCAFLQEMSQFYLQVSLLSHRENPLNWRFGPTADSSLSLTHTHTHSSTPRRTGFIITP